MPIKLAMKWGYPKFRWEFLHSQKNPWLFKKNTTLQINIKYSSPFPHHLVEDLEWGLQGQGIWRVGISAKQEGNNSKTMLGRKWGPTEVPAV